MSPTINRIINKQFFLYKGDLNPFDGGTPANKVVDDVVDTVEKAVQDTINYVKDDMVNDVVEIGGTIYEYSIGMPAQALKWVDEGILNNNLDLYSGGLVSDWENSFETIRKVGEGGDVESTLKSNVRVGAVAGATALTGGSLTAGATMVALTPEGSKSEWNELLGGVAKGGGVVAGGVFNTIGGAVSNIFNPSDEIVPLWTNDNNPLSGFYAENEDSKKIVLIVALLVSVGILTVALSTKKKRK